MNRTDAMIRVRFYFRCVFDTLLKMRVQSANIELAMGTLRSMAA